MVKHMQTRPLKPAKHSTKRDRSQDDRRDRITKVDRALKQYVSGKLDKSIIETHKVDGYLLKDYLFNALETGGVKRFSTKWMNDVLAKYGEEANPLKKLECDEDEIISDELVDAIARATSASNKIRTEEPLLDCLAHGPLLSVTGVIGILKAIRISKHVGLKVRDSIILAIMRHIADSTRGGRLSRGFGGCEGRLRPHFVRLVVTLSTQRY
jgi:hypothetical protein